jgi:hypothetical protein
VFLLLRQPLSATTARTFVTHKIKAEAAEKLLGGPLSLFSGEVDRTGRSFQMLKNSSKTSQLERKLYSGGSTLS